MKDSSASSRCGYITSERLDGAESSCHPGDAERLGSGRDCNDKRSEAAVGAIKVLSFLRAIRNSPRHNSRMANAIKKRRRQVGSSKSDQVRALLATGMSAPDIAKKVGCSTNLVYVIKSTMKSKGKRGAGRPAKA